MGTTANATTRLTRTASTAHTAHTARAVRAVTLGGLAAGLIWLAGNVLLAIMFATPQDGPYAWAGHASDIAGAVTMPALIPVTLGLLTVCGGGRGLAAATRLNVAGLIVSAAVSVLFVQGTVTFGASLAVAYASQILLFGAAYAACRAGRMSGRLPRRVALRGEVIGAAGAVGSLFLLAATPLPAHSLIRGIVYGTGLLTGVPYALFPFWLLALAARLPGHLTGSHPASHPARTH